MSLLFAFAVLLSAPQQNAGDALKDVVPMVALEYDKAHAIKFRCRCFCLCNDYGFYIDWAKNAPPELYAYEKRPARITCLASIGDLFAWLKNLPESVVVDQVRSCGSSAGGMSQEESDQLQQILKDKNFYLADIEDGNYGFCVCESKRKTMFKSMDEARKWIREHNDCEYCAKGKRIWPSPE